MADKRNQKARKRDKAQFREPYNAFGAAAALFRTPRTGKIQEVLCESGFGCGKSRAVGEFIVTLCDNYPGTRVLLLRKTQKSLRESILPMLEEQVLGAGHPAIVGTASRARRESYDWSNGSHIAIAGADTPDKFKSSEWDIAWFAEATEFTIDDIEIVKGRLGRSRYNWHPPFQMVIYDTNPGRRDHPLNLRFPPGVRDCPTELEVERGAPEVFSAEDRIRLLFRFEDNPTLTDAYLKGLSEMTGARRGRYFEHKWISEEGLVYSEFDPARNIVDRETMPVTMEYYVGGVDWGTNAPGVMQLWGVCDKRAYLVKEIYRTGQDIDWWADKADWLMQQYDMRAIFCDPSGGKDNLIKMLNKRLMKYGAGAIAKPANNAIDAGIQLVKELLKSDGVRPRLLVFRDSLVGVDEELAAKHRPTGFVSEVEAYTWANFEFGRTGQSRRDTPDPTCENHSMDTTRYVMMGLFEGSGFSTEKRKVDFKPGSWGDLFKHGEVGRKLSTPKRSLERWF